MRRFASLCLLGILLTLCACGKKSAAPNVDGGTDGGGQANRPKVDHQAHFTQMLAELKNKAPGRRATAIAGIVEYKDEAIPYLLEALSDKGVSDGAAYPGEPGSTREAAVIALLRIGPAGEKALVDTGLTTLVGGLTESNPAILEHTIIAIGLIGPGAKAAVKDVAKHCSSANESVRRAAYDVFARCKSVPLDAIVPLLTHSDPKIAADAARALGSVRPLPKDLLPRLVVQLKVNPETLPDAEEYAFVRNEIADALASFGDQAKEAVPALIELLRTTKEEDFVKYFKPSPGKDARNDESPAMTALRLIGKPAVPELAKLLDNPRGFVRWQAARVLGGIGPDAKEALPALQTSFDRELSQEMADFSAYVGIAQAQVQIGADPVQPVARLAALLNQKSDAVRYETLRALARFGRKAESAVMAIIPLLDDMEEAISVQAAETLRAIGPAAKAAIPALTRKLANEELQVRRNALRTIRSFGPVASETIPELTKLLADKDDAFRRDVIEAIAVIGPRAKAAVPDLVKLLKSEDDRERMLVLDALAAIGLEAKAAGKEILPLLNLREHDSRKAALKTLGQIGNSSPEVVDAIAARLGDDLKLVRIAAARALALLGPGAKSAAGALQTFGNPKKYPDPLAAVWAATALYRIGSDTDSNLKIVVAAIQNKSPAGRPARLAAMDAAEYLGAGAKAVQSDLIDAMNENTPISATDKTPVRLRAIAAIGKMGPAAKDAVPKLSNMLKESDVTIKRAALEALGQIGPAASFALPRLREIVRAEPAYAEQAQEVIDRIEGK